MVAEEREYGGEQAGRSSLTRSNEVLDSPEQRKRVVLYSFRDAQGVLQSFHDKIMPSYLIPTARVHESLTQKKCPVSVVHLQVQMWQRLWLMASQGRYRVVRTLDSRACLQWSVGQYFNS